MGRHVEGYKEYNDSGMGCYFQLNWKAQSKKMTEASYKIPVQFLIKEPRFSDSSQKNLLFLVGAGYIDLKVKFRGWW